MTELREAYSFCPYSDRACTLLKAFIGTTMARRRFSYEFDLKLLYCAVLLDAPSLLPQQLMIMLHLLSAPGPTLPSISPLCLTVAVFNFHSLNSQLPETRGQVPAPDPFQANVELTTLTTGKIYDIKPCRFQNGRRTCCRLHIL